MGRGSGRVVRACGRSVSPGRTTTSCPCLRAWLLAPLAGKNGWTLAEAATTTSWSPTNPVPVHSPTTKPTHDEPRKQVAPDLGVLGRLGHPHPLHRYERLVINERLVRDLLRHLPLADRVVPKRS